MQIISNTKTDLMQGDENLVFLKLNLGSENSLETYSAMTYPTYTFSTDSVTKELKPRSPFHIDKYGLNSFFHKSKESGDLKVYVAIFKSMSDDFDKRRLESEPEHGSTEESKAEPYTLYLYYGEDPHCKACPYNSGGSKGIMIANLILSLIALVFVSFFIVRGYIILCRKPKGGVTSPSGEYQKKEDDSYQFHQSEDQKWGKDMENYQQEPDQFGTNQNSDANVVFNQTGESSGYPPQSKKLGEISNDYRLNSNEKMISKNKEFF